MGKYYSSFPGALKTSPFHEKCLKEIITCVDEERKKELKTILELYQKAMYKIYPEKE